jgi:hypothetical protein
LYFGSITDEETAVKDDAQFSLEAMDMSPFYRPNNFEFDE